MQHWAYYLILCVSVNAGFPHAFDLMLEYSSAMNINTRELHTCVDCVTMKLIEIHTNVKNSHYFITG